jgi:hypothetical protein
MRTTHHVVEAGRWRIPVTEFRKGRSGETVLVLSDSGRRSLSQAVRNALGNGKRVFAADLFAFGEQIIAGGERHYCFMECVSSAGDRPLGICSAQLLALTKWIRSSAGVRKVDVVAQGLSTSLIALCAAALRPSGFGTLNINVPDSLRRLMDWAVDAAQDPVVFCFGLLEQFDIQDLVVLSHPVDIAIDGRGPMR